MTGVTLGIVAGAGSLPVVACREAIKAGWTVHLFPLAPIEVPEGVAGVHPVTLGAVEAMVRTAGAAGVTDLLLVGKVVKAPLVRGDLPLDAAAAGILSSAATGRDDDLMLSAIAFLQGRGLTVHDQREFLGPCLAREGRIAGPEMGPERRRDALLAFELAKGIGGLDIGQTMVVTRGVPVAAEALEGTDETIRRAGKLAGPGCLVAKVAKPRQDFRFDVPTVGEGTIGTMVEAGATVLVVEAGAVIIPDGDAFTSAAAAAGISVFGMTPGDG
jgi:hypothetical protein